MTQRKWHTFAYAIENKGWDYPYKYRPSEIITALRAAFLFIHVHQRLALYDVADKPAFFRWLLFHPLNDLFSISINAYLAGSEGYEPYVNFLTNLLGLASSESLSYLTASDLRHFQPSWATSLRFCYIINNHMLYDNPSSTCVTCWFILFGNTKYNTCFDLSLRYSFLFLRLRPGYPGRFLSTYQ